MLKFEISNFQFEIFLDPRPYNATVTFSAHYFLTVNYKHNLPVLFNLSVRLSVLPMVFYLFCTTIHI